MVVCLPKFIQKGDHRLNGYHRNCRHHEGVAHRAFSHEKGIEKAGQNNFGTARIVYKLDADPKRQEAQDVGIGSQENSCGTTEKVGKIPSTASLEARRSDETAIRLALPAVTSTLTAVCQREISTRAVL